MRLLRSGHDELVRSAIRRFSPAIRRFDDPSKRARSYSGPSTKWYQRSASADQRWDPPRGVPVAIVVARTAARRAVRSDDPIGRRGGTIVLRSHAV
jgi:hypothetical protein